ncbi:MAG: Tad domain-containing protein [Archangiaceae bacterium]|nr:Tad domain-containing protein [Archangiaceae bacterium]
MQVRARGQVLALGALTLVLIALMVFITIAISVRIHERQELQTTADAAAYSTAVATARAFNAVSAENRVLIAQMASIAAAQSTLSWVVFYHGALNQARDALAEIASQSACGGTFGAARANIMAEDTRLIQLFERSDCGYWGFSGYDALSAEYVRSDLYETALDVADNQRQLYDDMVAQLPGIPDRVALAASASDPFAASGEEFRVASNHLVTRRERRAALVREQQQPIDMVRATMATRGQDPFISSRAANWRTNGWSGADFIARRLQAVIGYGSPLVVKVTDWGTSYFGDDGPSRASGPGETTGMDGEMLRGADWMKWRRVGNVENMTVWGAWGEDAGRFWFEWPAPPAGCNVGAATEDAFGYLLTTGPNDDRDNHMWRRGMLDDYREWDDTQAQVFARCWPQPRHGFKRVPPGATNPRSIWPVFTDFDGDRLDDGDDSVRDVFGQPKTMVAIKRDYRARQAAGLLPDPWQLSFKLGFSPGAPGSGLDLVKDRSVPGLRRAIALSSGFVYYHRRRHFREPPNFLNPFWRATLTASDIDERRSDFGASARETLDDFGESYAASTLERLGRVGYEAMP